MTIAKLEITDFFELQVAPNEMMTKFGGFPDWIDEPCIPLNPLYNEPFMFLGQIQLDQRIFPSIDAKMAYVFGAVDMGSSSAIVLQPGNTLLHSTNGMLEKPIKCVLLPHIWTLSGNSDALNGWGVNVEHGSDLPYPIQSDDYEQAMEEFVGDKIGGTPWISDEFLPEDDLSEWCVLLQLDGLIKEGYERPLPLDFCGGGMRTWFLSKDGKRFLYFES